MRFGRYEVLFRIAAGGMAEVYAARMVGEGGFEKPVALKRMLPTLAEDERFVQMFLDEGRIAAHISSPHVVSTLDMGRAEDDSLYLVMELVVGVSLSALLRSMLKRDGSLLPVPIATELLAQAAVGLHDAHEAKTMYGRSLEIVHRDVSPQNVLIDVHGRVRITDFGVARALERSTQTQSGEVKGKLSYFAPEQIRGRHVDRRTDVFALGIVSWETLAGRRLFIGDNPAQTLDRVMSLEIPRLDQIRPDVPAAVADAIAHALERDPDRRTPTAAAFAEDLRYALRPAGAAALGALVRENGGEALMRLEEGLRAQSPSGLSRLRAASEAAIAEPNSAPSEASFAIRSVPPPPTLAQRARGPSSQAGQPSPIAPLGDPLPPLDDLSLVVEVEPAHRPSAKLVLGVVALVFAAGALGTAGYLLAGRHSSVGTAAIAPPPSSTPPTQAAAPGAGFAPSAGMGESPASSLAPPAIDPTDDDSSAGSNDDRRAGRGLSRRPRRPDSASPVAPPAAAPPTAAPTPTAPVAPRATVSSHPPTSASASTMTTSPAASTGVTSTTGGPGTSMTSARPGLVGLDEFDRDVQ